jgi:hypothetical protein
MILIFGKRVTGESFRGKRPVEKSRVAFLYAQQFFDESQEIAKCVAGRLTTHIAIRY